jgi:hypothetical protein
LLKQAKKHGEMLDAGNGKVKYVLDDIVYVENPSSKVGITAWRDTNSGRGRRGGREGGRGRGGAGRL